MEFLDSIEDALGKEDVKQNYFVLMIQKRRPMMIEEQ